MSADGAFEGFKEHDGLTAAVDQKFRDMIISRSDTRGSGELVLNVAWNRSTFR